MYAVTGTVLTFAQWEEGRQNYVTQTRPEKGFWGLKDKKEMNCPGRADKLRKWDEVSADAARDCFR